MSSKIADLTITKGTGSVLTLATQGKYVNDDKYFNIDVQPGAGTVTVASTDATIQSDSNERNISDIIGTKSSTAPSSGYYLKVNASGTGSSSITTAGWLDVGSLGTATTSGSFYFPVDEASISVNGVISITPVASITGDNITLSNTDNGVLVYSNGGASASANLFTGCSQSGYVASGTSVTRTISSGSSPTGTSVSSYISGVNLEAPESGTRSFSITVPNGTNDTITYLFTVDSNGNTTIE